ncbi:Splicing factor U2af large subunit B [Camellia lanceoleosa]|uniref:Splicing factor U2af large subunit B n=1 Tax=Camellia lanceoleosa TaxID=1840588 RepID=A0ACC0F3I0_9ERIC|nr:Splicing factor U2af large subunit B [Camellia lanceoleosa]
MILTEAVEEKNRSSKSNNGASATKKNKINQTLKRVRNLSSMTEQMSKAMLDSVGIATGTKMAPVVQLQVGKAFLAMVDSSSSSFFADFCYFEDIDWLIHSLSRQYMDELEGQDLTNVQERLKSEFHTWHCTFTADSAEKVLKKTNAKASVQKGKILEVVKEVPLDPMAEKLRQERPLRGFDLMKDRDTGNSKGYGFCVYKDPAATEIACAALNGLKMGDKTLTVRHATMRITGNPLGPWSDKFTTELGIVTRQFAPQNVPKWSFISPEDKETLIAYLREGFIFSNEPYAIASILGMMKL